MMDIIEKLDEAGVSFDKDLVEKALKIANENNGNFQCVLSSMLSFLPDEDSVISVILRDVYIRGEISKDDIISNFGDDVYKILKTLKKLAVVETLDNEDDVQGEVLRNMFLAMAKDMRLVIIDLTEKLCRLRSYKKLAVASNNDGNSYYRKCAKRCLALYVPIADRLGVYSIKTEMEDLAFYYANPLEYQKIYKQLQELRERYNVHIAKITNTLKRFLEERGVNARVSGRIKSIYSIYKKLRKKGLSRVSDLYDIYAMRVVLDTKSVGDVEVVDNLYSVLGAIHSVWKPLSGRFKDYIAIPKPNGYRSLHTVVLGIASDQNNQPVEIQIRNEFMHQDAEFGVAAHWLYKEVNSSSENVASSHAKWLKSLHDIKDDLQSSLDELGGVEFDFFDDKIFVLTPNGQVKTLPKDASPIDFAYSVHSDLGNKCVMAKVGGRVVPLSYELQSGDMVEIITRNDAEPKLQWLSFVKSSSAKNKIKAYFSALNSDAHIKEGKRLLNRYLERIGKPSLDQNYSILKEYLGKNLNVGDRESLLAEIGKGGKLVGDVVSKIFPYEGRIGKNKVTGSNSSVRTVVGNDSFHESGEVLVGGEEGLPVKFASCCNPTFPDSIIGYVTRGTHITIHRISCTILEDLDVERFVPADWKDNWHVPHYQVKVELLSVFKGHLMQDVFREATSLSIDIVDVSTTESASNALRKTILSLDVTDMSVLDTFFDRLEAIAGVVKVVRRDS